MITGPIATRLGITHVGAATFMTVALTSGQANASPTHATLNLASKAIYWRSARNRPVDAVRPRSPFGAS